MLTGIDTSHWTPVRDYGEARDGGISVAIHKATEGDSYVDPTYGDHRRRAMAAGLEFGAYLFLRAEGDPLAQAQWFVRHAQPLDDLFIAVDVERRHFPDGSYSDPSHEQVVHTVGWLADLTEKWPFIYCTESYWRTVIAGEWPNCPLWVARWRPPPHVPPQPFPVPVGAAQPELWQFTNGLTVPGIDQPVDGNRYFGDLARLRDHLV